MDLELFSSIERDNDGIDSEASTLVLFPESNEEGTHAYQTALEAVNEWQRNCFNKRERCEQIQLDELRRAALGRFVEATQFYNMFQSLPTVRDLKDMERYMM